MGMWTLVKVDHNNEDKPEFVCAFRSKREATVHAERIVDTFTGKEFCTFYAKEIKEEQQ